MTDKQRDKIKTLLIASVAILIVIFIAIIYSGGLVADWVLKGLVIYAVLVMAYVILKP